MSSYITCRKTNVYYGNFIKTSVSRFNGSHRQEQGVYQLQLNSI